MKTLPLFMSLIVAGFCMSAQTYTGNILITLDKSQLAAPCNLSVDTEHVVYMHSGAGFTDNTAVWQSIVGYWGLRDSIGLMRTVNADTYTICMNIDHYYTHYAQPDSANGGEGLGPLPAGATVYNIGLVFRDQGPFTVDSIGDKGLAPGCEDIFLLGTNTNHITVQDADGNPVSAVTAITVAGCPANTIGSYGADYTGIHNIESQNIQVSPNPFTDQVKIQFDMQSILSASIQVYDVMGRVVADFTPDLRRGYNSFSWDGMGADGVRVSAGAYLLKVTDGTTVMTAKLIKQ